MILNQKDFTAFLDNHVKNNTSRRLFINYYQPVSQEIWERLVDKFIGASTNYFYCCKPVGGFSFFASDELISISRQNFKEINYIRESFDRLKSQIVSNAGDFNLTHNPLFFGITKFPSEIKGEFWIDFSDSKWFAPKLMLHQEENKHYLVVNFIYYAGVDEYLHTVVEKLLQEDALPSSKSAVSYKISDLGVNDWDEKINYALKNISDGTIEKIVLARYIDLDLSGQPRIKSIIKKLEEQFPDCYTFVYKSGQSFFFGSSPEKLFSIQNRLLQTDALAGSIKRGDTEDADLILQEQLLNDKKNLSEHNAVINFLKDQLTPLADEVSIENKPVIKKLSNIQHLYTPIAAKLKKGVSVFSLLEKIHPTPAVCGIPPHTSQNLINEIENFERGLYAGALGWVGLNDTAEMFVGIRSAVLKENRLRAFAGGGIVKGSNSADEYNETVLKLKPILSLFENENINKS